jgi:hypothetical protein
MRKREREEWERFGKHKLALRIDAKRRREDFILRERSKRDPPCMLSNWHSCKREAHSKAGECHEKGELSLEEETQKWGKKPPILNLNLSLMPQGVTQGVEWAPHVVPITKWPIQWRW